MDKGKLEKLYDDASRSKLIQMWQTSEKLETEATLTIRKSEDIQSNIRTVIKKKFSEISDKTEYFQGNEQVRELNKQWALTAASMVKVRRSIRLDKFHNNLNLYVHPRYGIKKHKCYSGWSPFSSVDPRRVYGKKFYITGAILEFSDTGNNDRLDFDYLDNIPQLDSERVKMFAGITNDIVHMFNSWAKFYGAGNIKKRDDLDLIANVTKEHGSLDDMEVTDVLNRLDDLLKLQRNFADELIAQKAKWQPVIDKWHGLNKNFVVLAELAKTKLEI